MRSRRRSALALGLAACLPGGGRGEEAPAAPPGPPVFMRLKPEARLEHREREQCWIGTGGIVLKRGDATLTASRIVYWEKEGAAYAEGFVVFEDPDRRVFAEKGYYSWTTGRGRLEKGRVIRHDPGRGIHYYVTGDAIEIEGDQTVFREVSVTTCSFADPHYAWKAQEMVLTEGKVGALPQVVSRGNVLKFGDVVAGYVPRWSRSLGRTHFPLKETKAGRENDLGDYLRTSWGMPFWDRGDLYMHVDYFTRHGFAGGPEGRWHAQEGDRDYEGRALAYGLEDRGKDPGDVPLEVENRGWLYAVDHRFYPGGWRSILEASRLSDARFLPLYFEKVSRIGKEQETRAYLQRIQGDYAGSVLMKPRINDFQDQVEYLPRANFRTLSRSFLDGKVLWNSNTEFSELRHRTSDAPGAEGRDESAGRLDTRHEGIVPFPVGPLHAQAFVEERATWFSETKESNIDQVRVISGGGMRVGTQFMKPLAASSEFWNIRAMRHILVPQVEYRTAYDSTLRNDRPMAFDAVDAADRFERLTFSLDNIWQAKRRPARRTETDQPEAEPPPLVTADFATLSLRMDYFPVPHRDNNDHPWGPLGGEFRIVPRDFMAAYTDWKYDPQVADGLETWNVGMTLNPDYAEAFGSDRFGRSRFSARALESSASGAPDVGSFSDRWSLNLENRYVKGDSSTLNATFTYILSERWSVGIEQEYQWIPGHRGDQRLMLRRDLHEWTAEFSLSRDANHGASVFFVVFPKGLF